MTAPTHIAFAELLYLLILTTTGVALNIPNALLIAISSTLPDIDTGASRIGKFFPFLSLKLERRFGHRTLTHSLSCVLMLSLLLIPLCLIGTDIYTCFVIGYLSHPLLDTGTVNGTKLFYPFSNLRCVFPLDVNNPHRYRVQTGSPIEKVLGVVFFVGCIPTFYVASQGYERFIRVTQQSIEAAVRDYEQFSRDHFVLASIDSYDMLTKQPFKSTCEIVGALNPHTLVFKSPDGRLHTVGKSFEADYVAESIICQKDRPSCATVRIVDMSNQLLAQLGALVDTSVENYFFGDVATLDRVSLPENIRLFSPITGSGGEIKLNFATLGDIREYNLEFVYVTKGMLTIKSITSFTPDRESASPALTLPRLDNFAQLSYIIDPKDSVRIVGQKGDTIRHGDLLAVKLAPDFFEEQLVLSDEKLSALTSQAAGVREDFGRRKVAAGLELARDSAGYQHMLTLVKSGFASPGVLYGSELKWRKGKDALSGLLGAEAAMERRYLLDIARLHMIESQLRAKARAARLQADIRSPIDGVLLEIRQLPHDNKTRLVFIIRRNI